jgi:hypothetical protein
MVPRAQLLWAFAAATQYFVPNAHFPGTAVQPALEPMQIQDAALLKRHIIAPEAQREPESGVAGWKSSAVMFGALAAVAGVSTLRSARLSMQAEATIDEAAGAGDPAPSASMDLEMAGISAEFGSKYWDPLKLGELSNEATMNWFRHAELKHGRVCMLAWVGWVVQLSGGHFQGNLDLAGEVSFASLSKLAPVDAWYAIPEKGRLQLIFLIGLTEWCTEACGPNGHYTKAGNPGDLTFLDYYPTIKVPEEKKAQFELAELKHGRLAMIGMASVISSIALPGSVPFLSNGNFIS